MLGEKIKPMQTQQERWQEIDDLLEEMVKGQQASLLKLAETLLPGITLEDLLQPNDYPDLETHPLFRYEEGMLAGILSVQAALRFLGVAQH